MRPSAQRTVSIGANVPPVLHGYRNFMWNLSRLSFENYRTFERAEEIFLAPLTVLIGRNSSGKSAIARLPLLLKEGHLTRCTGAP